jgi:dynein heavy chain
VFNCTVPTDASIDKIYGTIGSCQYSVKKGFSNEVRETIQKLVGLTRILWKSTRTALLPTPAKFHYIFNLRDLSRIWQGMIGTLSTVIDSERSALKLWIHECTRVLTDRFTDPEDKAWFEEEAARLTAEHLGKQYVKTVKNVSLFVDFMRDAPEPTGEEGEDADVELPKVYEPIDDFETLKERLLMFLGQYNEMVRGSPMNLVFFPDAMINLVKIARIIRNPGGNALLVGVGGSGKQSLTKLASFIAGYKTFQITLTR